MWFIVKTDSYTEQESIDFLKETYPNVIKETYLPLGRKVSKNNLGIERVRFLPLMHGLFFIKVETNRRLERILSHHGYFVYRGADYDTKTGTMQSRTFFSCIHLLCSGRKERDLGDIIRQARIPDEDMDRFIFYTEQMADGIEGLSIVDGRYSELIEKNDTIRILSGPMAGWVGVVKQVKHNGKKDRHLLVRFGNNHCLNISNIRQYDIRIEHEATAGAKAEAVGAWRAIDQLVGFLQEKAPQDDAPARLRQLLRTYHARQQVRRTSDMSDKGYANRKKQAEAEHKDSILAIFDESMRSNFHILANFFHADGATIDTALADLIPDAVLRPFLTPTSGIPVSEEGGYAVLRHNGIIELVLRCNLRHFFRNDGYDCGKYSPVFDEDYQYYAHVALLPTADGKTVAATSWGGFYGHYAALTAAERGKFLGDLKARKYPNLLRALTQGDCKFGEVGGIGGFSINIGVAYDAQNTDAMAQKAAQLLRAEHNAFHLIVAAAVEVWQGARLLVWRQLLQRHVLLHKVPVEDLPSVIFADPEFDAEIAKHDGVIDLPRMAKALDDKAAAIRHALQRGEFMQAMFSFLSASLVLSTHFSADAHYNYIGDTYNPDATLTALFGEITAWLTTTGKQSTPPSWLHHAAAHLCKGITELQAQDSFTYFKFPSFLKQARVVEKMSEGAD